MGEEGDRCNFVVGKDAYGRPPAARNCTYPLFQGRGGYRLMFRVTTAGPSPGGFWATPEMMSDSFRVPETVPNTGALAVIVTEPFCRDIP